MRMVTAGNLFAFGLKVFVGSLILSLIFLAQV